MPPRVTSSPSPKVVHDAGKLVGRHIGEVVVAYDGPATRQFAAEDVTARGLLVVLPVEAVRHVDGGAGPKGRFDVGRGGRPASGHARYKIQPCRRPSLAVARTLAGRGGCGRRRARVRHWQELLEHLEHVGAVAPAANLEVRRAVLGVLGGVLRYTVICEEANISTR